MWRHQREGGFLRDKYRKSGRDAMLNARRLISAYDIYRSRKSTEDMFVVLCVVVAMNTVTNTYMYNHTWSMITLLFRKNQSFWDDVKNYAENQLGKAPLVN